MIIPLHNAFGVTGAGGGGGPTFNPETDITWHSLFWAEGTAFTALGLSDGNNVSTWPNETAETDATAIGTNPVYTASTTALNSKPSVTFSSAANGLSGTYSAAPADADKVSYVVVGNFTTNVGTQTIIGGSGSAAAPKIYISVSGNFRIFAGTERDSSPTTKDTSPHLFVAVFSASGNDTLDLDGVNVINAQAGSTAVPGPTVVYLGTNGTIQPAAANVALAGVYAGDVTADASWSDMKSWVASHYGFSVS